MPLDQLSVYMDLKGSWVLSHALHKNEFLTVDQCAESKAMHLLENNIIASWSQDRGKYQDTINTNHKGQDGWTGPNQNEELWHSKTTEESESQVTLEDTTNKSAATGLFLEYIKVLCKANGKQASRKTGKICEEALHKRYQRSSF